MKHLIVLAIATVFTVGMSDANAQDLSKFVGKRKNTAEKETGNRLGREADKTVTKEVNKALDKIFGKEEAQPAKSDSAATPNATTPSATSASSSSGDAGSALGRSLMMRAMGVSGAANVKPVYEFDGFIEMTITDYMDGKQEGESALYTTYIDSKSMDYGMRFSEPGQEGTSIVIFDTENGVMLTLDEEEGERTGFAVGFTPDQTEAITQETEEEADAYAAYKTGKKKKILGYSCEEYLIEDDVTRVTMWITDELEGEMKKSYMQNATFSGIFMQAYNTKGTVMEYISEEIERNEKTVMTVTAVDLNKRNTISTAGYAIMNMGSVEEKKTDSPYESQ
jgi:hypothetical protein